MELDKTKPQTETDFGDETFDATPISSGGLTGFNDRIFALMRPKKKVSAKPKRTIQQEPIIDGIPKQNTPGQLVEIVIPPTHEIQNGLLMQKKTFIEKARDQLKFPVITKVPGVINGLALVVFAAGSYILYANLPTHPELVLGILMVSIAGNVLISQR